MHESENEMQRINDRIGHLEAQLAAEHELRMRAQNNERCFRELAEQIREVFWMTNPLGDVLVYISPAYEQIWGQTCQSLYEDPGRRLAWVHENDRQAVLIAFKRDGAAGEYDETFRIRRPDGQVRWIRDRAFPVYDDQGEIYRLAGFALDITDRVGKDDRLAELNSSISARERMAVFAALGTGMAHDLSQPVTAARNFIAQARMKLDNEQVTVPIDRAEAELERAASMIRHLRDFARDGKPTRDTLALGPLIADVHQLMDPALRARDIRYKGPEPDSIAGLELAADRVLAQQILRNLIDNAASAFDDSSTSPQIMVDVQACDGHIHIRISDNGRGITDDVELFEPFVTTKDNGLGLGLSVSRTLARSHGGDLRVASRGRASQQSNGERTEFVLTLPLN